MFVKLRTGLIELNEKTQTRIITDEINGEIEKVIIKYGDDCTEDTNVRILTSDGEEIINVIGHKNNIWYPRNWNVKNQMYTGVNMVAPEEGALNADKYVATGSLYIFALGASKQEHIEDIIIIIRGKTTKGSVVKLKSLEIEKNLKSVIEKSTGMVHTGTTGAHHSRHNERRVRRGLIRNNIRAVFKELAAIEKKGFTIEKAEEGVKELAEYIEGALFARKFEGISNKLSELIKTYILRSIVKKVPKITVMEYLKRKGLSSAKANLIYRTENQSLRNKVREWSYAKIDPEGELKFKWVGPDDYRTTTTCKNITTRTENGVLLAKLKEIINDEVDKAKGRGELPGDYDAREYTPHFMCRHTFVRAYK